MSVVNNTLLLTAGAEGPYEIERSLRFRSSASAYLNRTFTSAGNRKTWTYSAWVKLGSLAAMPTLFDQYSDGENQSLLAFRSLGTGNDFQIRFYDLVSSSFTSNIYWAPLYRDPSAWYHVVFAADTTQATNTNRLKLYVNGVQITATTSATYPSQNTDLRINLNAPHFINQNGAGSQIGDHYLTEINFVDGQALTPSSFGEYNEDTGVWQPKKYAGTYGTNGFYLNFSDNASTTTLGDDLSGNGNDWTTNNFSLTAGATYDSMIDTPTPYDDGGNGRGNYAVLNPLVSSSYQNITQGNLATFSNTATDSGIAVSTMGASSGKFYWEITVSGGSSGYPVTGAIRNIPASGNGTVTGSSTLGGFSYYANLGFVVREGTVITTVATSTTNDIIGFALDIDNLQVAIYKNNTLLYTLTGLTAGAYFPATATYDSTGVYHNFGQRPFAYTPPTGFKALNTQNLPASTVVDGGEYFNAVLYTGTGAARSVTGVGFQPDWVWTKNRSISAFHGLNDVVRGAGNFLYSNSTSAEQTYSTDFVSFDADGFSLGSGSGSVTNGNGEAMVAWNWKANGAGVSNTDGSITSTVSANTTAGFSVVTYTGNGSASQTVGHGLGVKPSMIIVKDRDTNSSNDSWWVAHVGVPSSYLFLQDTAAASSATGTSNGAIAQTNATSSVIAFSNGSSTSNNLNESGDNYVAYCFAPVAGYSAFGSYTGNGSADGPFVFCGFRPRYLLVKNTDAVTNWFVYDSIRDTYNMVGNFLRANTSDAEGTFAAIDFLSNGFKLRDSSANNSSGQKHIFMAFAENPFKNSLAR